MRSGIQAAQPPTASGPNLSRYMFIFASGLEQCNSQEAQPWQYLRRVCVPWLLGGLMTVLVAIGLGGEAASTVRRAAVGVDRRPAGTVCAGTGGIRGRGDRTGRSRTGIQRGELCRVPRDTRDRRQRDTARDTVRPGDARRIRPVDRVGGSLMQDHAISASTGYTGTFVFVPEVVPRRRM